MHELRQSRVVVYCKTSNGFDTFIRRNAGFRLSNKLKRMQSLVAAQSCQSTGPIENSTQIIPCFFS